MQQREQWLVELARGRLLEDGDGRIRRHNSKVVGVLDDGGATPWVCFHGPLPEREWRDPVNVSFAGPPITYDQAAAAAKTTTTTAK